MTCHNGSQADDYSGPGLENPHPFPGADNLSCTDCHGGNPLGADKDSSHIPPPPEIGDRQQLAEDDTAYFNRLTLTGIDKFADYVVGGTTYTPAGLPAVHQPGRPARRHARDAQLRPVPLEAHADCVAGSLLATEAGHPVRGDVRRRRRQRSAPSQGLYEDTAADLGFRAVV